MTNVHFIFVTEKQLEQIGMTYDELMLYGVDMKHDNFVYLVDEDYNLDETLGEEMVKNVGICWKAKDFNYGDFMVTYFGISNQEGLTKELLECMGTTRDDLLTYLRWMTELNDKANYQTSQCKKVWDHAKDAYNTEEFVWDELISIEHPDKYMGMLEDSVKQAKELATYTPGYRHFSIIFSNRWNRDKECREYVTKSIALIWNEDKTKKEVLEFYLYFDKDFNPTHHELTERIHNN